MRRPLVPLSLACFALASVAPAAEVHPRTHQVSPTGIANGDVAQSPDEDLPRFSPDGEWLAWVQDATVNEGWDLWTARRWEGSTPVRISAAYPFGQGIIAFAITPDSSRVVFMAGTFSTGLFRLFSAPIDGSAAPVALHPAPPANGGVVNFALAPDGTRAVFLGDIANDGEFALWSVPVEGPPGSFDRLSPVPDLTGQDVEAYAISPTSAQVAFTGTLTADLFDEVWSAPLAGPAPSRPISPPPSEPALGVLVTADLPLVFSNGGERVLFAGDFQTPGTFQLLSNTPTGLPGQAEVLSPTPGTGGNVVEYAVAPDTDRVVLRGDLLVDEQFQLWSAAVDGSGSPVRISHPTPSAFTDVTSFAIGPGASPHVLFRSDASVDQAFDLYLVLLAGGTPTRLNADNVPTRNLEPDFTVAPDGERVVFRGNFSTAGKVELYSASVTGGAGSAVKICPVPPAGGNIETFAIDATSARVVFAGDALTAGRRELFSVPIAGPAVQSVRLHPAAGANENVAAFALAPDGARVAFLADLTTEGRDALWTAPVAGPDTAAVQAHADAVANGAAVAPLDWSPDARGVAFLGDLLVNDQFLLWDADEAIFAADHEEGDVSEWSIAVP